MNSSPKQSTETAASAANGRVGGNTPHRWHGVLDSALDGMGHTPLIRFGRIAKEEGLQCNLCQCGFSGPHGCQKLPCSCDMADMAI